MKPTQPGRWWAIHRDGVGPDRDPKIVWRLGDESDRDWDWVARVPSPAVCAALARYAAGLASISPGNPGSFEDDKWAEANAALGALNAALRAERDGAA